VKHHELRQQSPESLEQLLKSYQYHQRMIKLKFRESDGILVGEENVIEKRCHLVSNDKNGILAEIQVDGTSKIGRILGIKQDTHDDNDDDADTHSTSKSKKKKKQKKKTSDNEGSSNRLRPPRLIVKFVDADMDADMNDDAPSPTTKIIDVGQITTVWKLIQPLESDKEKKQNPPDFVDRIRQTVDQYLPIDQVETILERKYKFHVSRGRNIIEGGGVTMNPKKQQQQGVLTKKQIDMITAATSIGHDNDNISFEDADALRTISDRVLKQCLRCGSKFSRLLDSFSVEEEMFYDKVEGTIVNEYTGNRPKTRNRPGRQATTVYDRLTFCATVLAEDIPNSGRFKRMPCMWLPNATANPSSSSSSALETSAAPESTGTTTTSYSSVTLVNGGYIVVDQSIRAAAEGRQFASKALANGGRFDPGTNDERILCRLESLACGENLRKAQQQNRQHSSGTPPPTVRLEVDVRSTLQVMQLPFTSEGAQEALIRMGRWTKTTKNQDKGNVDSYTEKNVEYARWSSSVLEASNWYTQMNTIRSNEMKTTILELRKQERDEKQQQQQQQPPPTPNSEKKIKKKKKLSSSSVLLEGRTDLTMLPCLCIDAERTSFRDDAFGIRTRASTGRKVATTTNARFEVLLHIADVSDIYASDPFVVGTSCANTAATEVTAAAVREKEELEGNPSLSTTTTTTKTIKQKQPNALIKQQRNYLQELEQAACSRIKSQYDLPVGPLHLLPTPVLGSLSLNVYKQDWTSDPQTWPTSWQTLNEEVGSVNRCVTVWVYIDEATGSILDMGMERTIISRPLALSFEHATNLLDASAEQQQKFPPLLAKARSLLTVVEKTIQIWEDARLQDSEVARGREERLQAKEFVSKQVYANKQQQYDTGGGGGRGNGRNKRRDDGADGSFQRTRGHLLVDSTMVLYESAFRMMRAKQKVMIPIQFSGQHKDGGGTRSASAPLRTYIHGLAQQQGLAVLCKYGGRPLSNEECKEVGRRATQSHNVRKRSWSATHGVKNHVSWQQMKAVQSLQTHLTNHHHNKNQHPAERIVPAISTGSNSEVVIQGVGAVALCKGIPGTLKTGVKVMVKILNVDEKKGKVVVALHSNDHE